MQNAEKSNVRSIGQHNAVMVEKLCRITIESWVKLHRYGRSDAPQEVKNRLLEILGGGIFEWCWATRGIHRQSLQIDDAVTFSRLYEHLCAPSVRPTLCNKVCYTVSMISDRMRALAALARQAKGREARQLWQGYDYIFDVMFKLLDTGALAEMPNSSRCASLHESALFNFVSVLPTRWEVLRKQAGASGQVGAVAVSLGVALGLPVFAGVRAQQEGRVEAGHDGLMAWYQTPQARKQRGFYAEIGASIHTLAQEAMKLREYRDAAPYGTPRRAAAVEAISAIEMTMTAIISSGALYTIP